MSDPLDKKFNTVTQQLHMPVERKALVRAALISHMEQHSITVKKGLFASLVVLFNSQSRINRVIVFSTSVLFVLLMAGVGTNYAAANALPGDFLYSTKINVIEPVHALFLVTPEAKAEYALARATARLDESTQVELSEPEQARLTANFNTAMQEVNKQIAAIEDNGSADTAVALRTAVAVTLHDHGDGTESTVRAAAQKVLADLKEQKDKSAKKASRSENNTSIILNQETSDSDSTTIIVESDESADQSSTSTKNGKNPNKKSGSKNSSPAAGIAVDRDQISAELLGSAPLGTALPSILQSNNSNSGQEKQNSNKGKNTSTKQDAKQGDNQINLQSPVSLPLNLNLPTNTRVRFHDDDSSNKIEIKLP